ncbi:malto-oligosyltrehalose synthase [Roseomonas sp. HF4]|uniref:malto-oligosyltrehalose synthase n=1 Tax=Roseomonas sp. HF4 TaxID=2562313 RepID=UPI0010BFF59D|nr:malto-oligosyltrehalose synthase [Roseomonas sp. HF4]
MTPTATYRLQFHDGFGFADARAVVPYLDALGISHVYASPVLAARPGSPHGYDIIDHGRISDALGGMEGLRALSSDLRARGMGLLLDIVPNHMGVGGADNALWLDVLEWGRASPYATWFDIDWTPADARLNGRVLAPFLGAPYGDALAAGDLVLRLEPHEGSLSVWYHEHRFPVAARDYGGILPEPPTGDAVLDAAVSAWRHLARAPRSQHRARATAARRALAEALQGPAAASIVFARLARYDAATDGGAALHALLERQSYRLCWWRAASDEINYRRFFDINGLAGFRVELPGAFEAAHGLLLDLWAEGLIDGVRIDHVDGLADPRAYCRKLRRRMEARAPERPAGLAREPWILVEKILARHEHLPAEWQTDGTTGYEVMDRIGALLHDAAAEPLLDAAWADTAPDLSDFHAVERAARAQILSDYLAAELAGAALHVHRVLQGDLGTRDFTLTAVRRVLRAIVIEFPTYRTYASLSGGRGADAYVLDWAFSRAARRLRATQHELLARVRPILSGEALRRAKPGAERHDALQAIRRFQQLTGPVAAKSVEDTAFYRYLRLISRNEVGSDPLQLSVTRTAFHRFMRSRRRTPLALSGGATHDHKRGEDVRARLAVLTEDAAGWAATTERWRRMNAPLRATLDTTVAPDPADELHIYQTLLGAWPMGLDADDRRGVAAFLARVEGWLVKALREGKRHSDWALPDPAYEGSCLGFLRAAMDPARPQRFDRDVAAKAATIAAAGAAKGLLQTALKCIAPGVPDTYQGTEFWDLSLVDPDNRRPVDFAARAAALERAASPAAWHDEAVKLAWTAALLGLRRSRPALFLDGTWLPVNCRGPLRERVVGVARVAGDEAVLLVGLLHPTGLLEPGSLAPVRGAALGATTLVLPAAISGRRGWRILRPGCPAEDGVPGLRLVRLLEGAPVAIATTTPSTTLEA